MYCFFHLFSAREGLSLTDANELMRQSKKGKLPVVNAANEIVALISRTGRFTKLTIPGDCI